MAALCIVALQACQEENTLIDSGTCGAEGDGSNLTWTLTQDGTLTISGNGDMIDYSDAGYDYSPFSERLDFIRTVVMEEGVTTIGPLAFRECKYLTSVTIPGSVTYIGYYAFSGCTGLPSITIPENVTYMSDGAFMGCTGLKEIRVKAAMPPDFKDDHDFHTFSGVSPSIPVYVPAGSIEAYRNSVWGGTFSNFLPLP